LERGLEPDLCYWVTNQEMVRGKDDVDFAVDPPPDLALEVEVSRTSIPKLPIYLSLRVPEAWRWRSEKLEVLRLQERGEYAVIAASRELPDFPFQLAESFIEQRDLEDEIRLMARFEAAIASFRLP
jgi:Uma2 family endonuclease